MSFRGKRKDGEGLASDENEDHAPPNKVSKTFSAVDSDDSDDVVVCEISKNRRVSVRNWNGKIWVDIREFYVKDGKQLPGKKGTFSLCFISKVYDVKPLLFFSSLSLNMKFDLISNIYNKV
ncbi:hypothetical protein PVK06_037676 [Gossypium arboreum]|uniref:Transcriptional coactivator p15 (PC4) C-terminal domain-containing protein n=1 Tax=Gossypium arboreum TaxID=29729 RepID=A0ABR0MY07_GOSAR|nr:hypothetical protein PVK06_037676 [Gossypium arboreum]